MKQKFRKITVKNLKFLWCFSEKWMGKYWQSYLTIKLETDKQAQVIIKYLSEDTYICSNPLNTGLPVRKNQEELELNLNKPKFIAEILSYLLENEVDLTKQKKYLFANGFHRIRKSLYMTKTGRISEHFHVLPIFGPICTISMMKRFLFMMTMEFLIWKDIPTRLICLCPRRTGVLPTV